MLWAAFSSGWSASQEPSSVGTWAFATAPIVEANVVAYGDRFWPIAKLPLILEATFLLELDHNPKGVRADPAGSSDKPGKESLANGGFGSSRRRIRTFANRSRVGRDLKLP